MKFKHIISLFAGILILSSCHGDLDIKQKSGITASSMWEDENDAESAMYGLYNKFRSTFSTNYIYWGEYRTGLWGEGMTTQTARDQVYQNEIGPDHAQTNWGDIYTTINNANLIIKYTPNISFSSEDNKNKVLANAYYVRAFCYYWIGRIWGDAPVLTEGFESDQQEGLFPTKDSADKVFGQVGNDVETALSLMPESVSDRNLASKGAINMLKADYNLWLYKVRNGGQIALDAANVAVTAVLSNNLYELEDNYADIFENEQGKEIIFAWSYIKDEYTGGYPSDYLVPSQYVSDDAIENPVKVGSHQQWCFYTEEYKAILSEVISDQRTKVSFETYFDEPKNATFQWINKFAGEWTNGTRVFDSDIIVYRYADALLFDAEIKLAKQDLFGALASLNKIAERAYGVKSYYNAGLSIFTLEEGILNERLKEFAAEGKLWWDYIRFGVAFEKNPYLKGRENELNVLLWPVSSTSINKNPNITQTPGYDK
ncbi:MAG: RagB/SusD family nutrient uptake outer membrane protein [Massilibacteroides sp.]|nr:RagB/SusD family nutrient uptake outer membrane protein [Massilibacteroides sp.]MDD4116168.1 RagB/SusD family nutrient uptake outer membrane protein [Massilibacteroides sp.]MDD4661167.1 RagB/SusD family nutrient uptake outer membrane protein [Massilibacteroides sp.]